MILLIWVMWWINQYIMIIIMLNFLIAIICQSYEEVMTQTLLEKYT